MKYSSLARSIGNTPHIGMGLLFPNGNVWIKDERRNPAGSIKDRVALGMVETAERNGQLKPGGVIVEPTSGNTGIGLAMIAAVKGYRIVLTMPESMSLERRRLLGVYGAELVLTPATQGMNGAIRRANEIVAATPNAWMPMQFENPANPKAHEQTAKEIITDFPDGIDYFVAGVGTGGHISGVGGALKGAFPSVKIIAVEPDASPLLSGGIAGSHAIQGIGANFVPRNLNRSIIDEVFRVSNAEAYEFTRKCVKAEGLLVGISTGANVAAVSRLLRRIDGNKCVLTIACDSGERYLSEESLWR